MKKIINGKLYDTDTATFIGEYSNILNIRDHDYFKEELYRKKTGEYFIYGKGGGLSKYAKHIDYQHSCAGEKIFPLSYDEAREWAEKHLDVHGYADEFEVFIEDKNKILVSFYLPIGLVDLLRQKAKKTGVGPSELITKILEQKL